MISIVFSAHVSENTSLLIAKNIFREFHDSKNQNNFKIKNYDIISDETSPLI